MKFLSNNQQNLNDIIFAEKNKSYGAYAIRASYNNSLLKALSIIFSAILLATGCLYLFNMRHAAEEKKFIIPDNPILKIFEVDNTPKKPKAPEPPRSNPPTGQKAAALGTIVRDSLPEDKNANNTTNVTLQTTGTNTTDVFDPNTGTSTLTGVETGTNTGGPLVKSNEPFVIVEEMPEFEGGMNALLNFVSRNIVYPNRAREAGVEGVVYVSFVVDENAKVTDVKIEKGIGAGCDEESVRVVSKIPNFKKAGKNQGHIVKVRYNIPIKYRLGK